MDFELPFTEPQVVAAKERIRERIWQLHHIDLLIPHSHTTVRPGMCQSGRPLIVARSAAFFVALRDDDVEGPDLLRSSLDSVVERIAARLIYKVLALDRQVAILVNLSLMQWVRFHDGQAGYVAFVYIRYP